MALFLLLSAISAQVGHGAQYVDPLQEALTTTAEAKESATPKGLPMQQGHKRCVPNIEGRPKQPPQLVDGLLWVPRVVLFPLYLTTEYLVRWPLGILAKTVERYKLVEWATNFTTLNDGDGGILPLLRIDRGFSPAVGLVLYGDNLGWPGLDARVGADFNFERNMTAGAQVQYRLLNDWVQFGARFSLERRDDFIFYGTGPRTTDADETRFFRSKVMGLLRATVGPTAGLGASLSVEVSDNNFECSSDPRADVCQHPLILAQANTPTTSFFSSGYTLLRMKLNTHWDSRAPRPKPGGGVRVDIRGRFGKGLHVDQQIVFVRYGGEISGFWDVVPGSQRVLSLRLLIENTWVGSNGDIPFAELITLGGVETMRGFLHARFHGRSAVVASFEYRYPIWSFLDGNLLFEVGNAFSKNLGNFEMGLLRGNFGIGIRTIASRFVSVDLLFALGTTTFNTRHFKIDHARLTLGTNWGF